MCVVGLDALGNNFFSVISTTTCLCTLKATLDAYLLWGVEVENGFWSTNQSLEILCLVYGSGETIKYI